MIIASTGEKTSKPYSPGSNAYHVKPVQHGDHLDVLTHVLQYWLNEVLLPSNEEPAR